MNKIIGRGRLNTDVSARLSKLRKLIVLGAFISVLAMLVFPAAGKTVDETWDVEFNGVGDPAGAGWTHHGNHYHSLNARFGLPNLVPGWVTGSGNKGGYWSVPLPSVLTSAKGWSLEWAMAAANNTPMPLMDRVIQLQDDVSLIQIGYDATNNLVVLSDDLTNKNVTASVKLYDGAGNENAIRHTYRLVRKPGSKTVELYIDNDFSKPALQIAVSGQPESPRGAITKIFESGFESAWDYWRVKAGAALPKPRQKPVLSILGAADKDPKATQGYKTYIVAPAINNETFLPGHPLPSACRDEKVIKVLCARGEYEPASFMIEAAKPLKQVMVKVSPLKGHTGVLAPETVDVRIAQKFYRVTTWGCVTMPWVLVHDPHMLEIVDRHPKWITEITEESWKSPGGRTLAEYKSGNSKINALVKDLVDSDTLQPIDIEDFQQFWLTVHVSDDSNAGTYASEVTISADNTQPTTLTLEVTIPAFDLLPPEFEYSAYYPAYLERPGMTDSEREKLHPITDEQYLAEARNMLAHGCTNPCLYAGPEQDESGKIHFNYLSRIMDLREKAGMPKGLTLYLMDGAGMTLKQGALTEEQKQRNMEVAKATVAWAKSRGYSGALFMGADEFSGESLRAMRDSYASIKAGGSGIWVAGGADLVNFMSDVVGNPIFAHPGAMGVDQSVQWQVDPVQWLLHPELYPNWDPQVLLAPEYQQLIKTAHKHGNKMFTYFDPQGGQPFPEYHRRHRGIGLWKTGVDGTMTWAYIQLSPPTARANDPYFQDGFPYSPNVFVLRGPRGVLDTLAWEGYREGYDDARYLATLKDAIAQAKTAGRHAPLIAETQRWLDSLPTDVDLDEWRLEMARRTEKLLEKQ